mmetsp:Transcript_54704/g.163500  ORF Transcript_54704/g.163500 Transcript_54704/m.163500 type:complete len:213 (-) Transcript_54704:435-1073(-)
MRRVGGGFVVVVFAFAFAFAATGAVERKNDGTSFGRCHGSVRNGFGVHSSVLVARIGSVRGTAVVAGVGVGGAQGQYHRRPPRRCDGVLVMAGIFPVGIAAGFPRRSLFTAGMKGIFLCGRCTSLLFRICKFLLPLALFISGGTVTPVGLEIIILIMVDLILTVVIIPMTCVVFPVRIIIQVRESPYHCQHIGDVVVMMNVHCRRRSLHGRV